MTSVIGDEVRVEPQAIALKLREAALLMVLRLRRWRPQQSTLRISRYCYFVAFSMIVWPFAAPSIFGQTTKPAPSDAIQYVSPNGLDSNDGLSWGTAKKTLAGAVAVTNASRGGGRIYVASGSYSWSSTVTLSRPVRLECASGKATHFTYTGTSGAAILIAWAPAGQWDGAGIYGCFFTGPGSTTRTSAIQVSDSHHYVSGPVIENVYIGVHKNLTSGFETGINIPTNSPETQNVQIVNSTIMDVGTGVNAYGEQITIRGGSISECTTSVNVQTNTTEVTSTGVSYDADTGAYVLVNGGIFTSVGDHYETNPVPLTRAGFIQNGGRVTIVGGTMMDDLKSGNQTAFITNTGPVGFLFVLGTTAWSGGQAVSYLATPPLAGAVDGVIAFDNMMTDTRTPQWPSSGQIGAGRLTIIPSHTRGTSYEPHVFYHQDLKFGGNNAAYNMATLDAHTLTGSYTYTFPNSGGQLALSGANGVSAGIINMNGGRGSHTFARPYASAPVCVAADTTGATTVKVTSTAAAVSVAGTGSDIVKWVCTPASN